MRLPWQSVNRGRHDVGARHRTTRIRPNSVPARRSSVSTTSQTARRGSAQDLWISRSRPRTRPPPPSTAGFTWPLVYEARGQIERECRCSHRSSPAPRRRGPVPSDALQPSNSWASRSQSGSHATAWPRYHAFGWYALRVQVSFKAKSGPEQRVSSRV